MELHANRSLDIASATFSYHTFYPNEALVIAAEAMAFARAQTALYGKWWMKNSKVHVTMMTGLKTESIIVRIPMCRFHHRYPSSPRI